LTGTIEADETYVGGKPRYRGNRPGRNTASRQPVFCAVERGGQLRRRVIADVKSATLKQALKEEVDRQARIITDDYSAYRSLTKTDFAGGHETVCHSTREYVKAGTDIHTNTVESTHALVKRGIVGIYHNVSREYLHRYLWQFDFMWNNRQMNDGERTVAGIKCAEGKRLMYKDPKATVYTNNREQEKSNEQFEPF
jgi:transposase-like protein